MEDEPVSMIGEMSTDPIADIAYALDSDHLFSGFVLGKAAKVSTGIIHAYICNIFINLLLCVPKREGELEADPPSGPAGLGSQGRARPMDTFGCVALNTPVRP